jgi:hypothetical protein
MGVPTAIYVILPQNKAAGIVFFRKADDWMADPIAGDESLLRLPEIGIELPLAEIYAGLSFDPDAAEAVTEARNS